MTLELLDPDGFEITLTVSLYAGELESVDAARCYDEDSNPVDLDVDEAVARVGGMRAVRAEVEA